MSEIVMYIIARADLQMSPGKLGSQVGHAVHLALRLCPEDSEDLKMWESASYAKIVLKVDSLEELLALHAKIGEATAVLVRDEGRTEIAPTATAIGIIPMSKLAAFPLVGHLKLYR